MKLQFAGCGSQFASREQYQSNMVLTAASGRRMLIDCGTDAKFSLSELNLAPADLDAVYISHLHADHIGGMEWLALSTLFSPEEKRLVLFCEEETLDDLWTKSLRGGLDRIGGRDMVLSNYFDCRPLASNGSFAWEGLDLELVPTAHIPTPTSTLYCYGLLINPPEVGAGAVYLTADTQYKPEGLMPHYQRASLILHDCETAPVHSSVHAHYDDLITLPADIRGKMWLYHYQLDPPQDAAADGFAGFVTKGQTF